MAGEELGEEGENKVLSESYLRGVSRFSMSWRRYLPRHYSLKS